MKLNEAIEAYTFDDMVLAPRFSSIKSRKDPSTKTKVGNIELEIPIISSPMNTVTESRMMTAMAFNLCSSVVHRYMSIEEQSSIARDCLVSDSGFFAIGATGDFIERAQALRNHAVMKFC